MGQEIKAMYFMGNKIFPTSIVGEEKLYHGYLNQDGKQTVSNMLIEEIQDNGQTILHFQWTINVYCLYKENSSQNNYLENIAYNGVAAETQYFFYWDADRNLWRWNWKTIIGFTRRYIYRTYNDALNQV